MRFHHCNYQILWLMLLSLVGWNRPSTPAVDCVRDQAKIVRTIIDKKILPILNRYSVSMPKDCPFYYGHDLFGWHERHKIRLQSTNSPAWQCGLCGATFHTETHLDAHFDQVHSGTNDLKNKSVCLADYCDIMRCDVFKRLVTSDNETSSSQDNDKHHENISEEPVDWHLQCSDHVQHKLRTKCMAIIKDCLSGLLIGLSIKDFQDVEDDLNHAICSYLTCKRYWQYSLLEERRVPVLFYLIIGSTLAGGVWFWYYFVWFFFSSGSTIKSEPSGWIRSNRSSYNSLGAVRDRMNRQERCAPIFPPRLPYMEYRGMALRNKQHNLHKYREYNGGECMMKYTRKVNYRDTL